MSDHEQTLEEYWKKRAEKAEARVKELETLLDVFCGLQIPELRAEVERLRNNRKDDERLMRQARDALCGRYGEMRQVHDALCGRLAASEGPEGEKAKGSSP